VKRPRHTHALRSTPALLRGALLGILLFALIGTSVELLLLGHTEGFWQWIPLALIAAAFVTLGAHAFLRRAATLRAIQGTMALFLIGGVAGLVLHYRGNMEFELEMYPSISGWPLFRESITGATPALAPGMMIQMGLLGLAYTCRHPLLAGVADVESTRQTTETKT